MLDELTRRVAQALPEGLDQLQTDLEQNIRAALATALSRMDLVTREEFDVQAGVLARTREKLTVLEDRLRELEEGQPGDDRDSRSGQPQEAR
jgi:BMFP domain-containing protein YqiC